MLTTYNDIYIRARRSLKEAGIEAYTQEARLLVAHAAGKTVEELLRDLPLYVSGDFPAKVDEAIRRRLDGEPAAYITGSWEFYGIGLEITPDVLIPRPDTEIMVRAAIELYRNAPTAPRILDLCCGSGCIGIALAKNLPGSRVVLVDNSHAAMSIARKNAIDAHPDNPIICIDADATKVPPSLMGQFDLICCNAPYIPTGELAGLDRSVIDFEPRSALDGGEDGLDIIRPVVALWKKLLRPNGVMMLEIGEGQSGPVRELMQSEGFSELRVLRDPGGCGRIVIGMLAR